jgi:hypothetical protein
VTPAQRYLAAAKTLKDVAGVDVEEISTRHEIFGAITLDGLERLADVCTLLSRARAENLAPGVTTYPAEIAEVSCTSRDEDCADVACPDHAERNIQTRVPSKVIPVKGTTIQKGNR